MRSARSCPAGSPTPSRRCSGWPCCLRSSSRCRADGGACSPDGGAKRRTPGTPFPHYACAPCGLRALTGGACSPDGGAKRRTPGTPFPHYACAPCGLRALTGAACSPDGGAKRRNPGTPFPHYACAPCRLRRRQRLLDRQEIPPSQPLLQRLAQQIGRMKGGGGADFTAAGVEREPASARLEDSVAAAEQRLCRWSAETDQHVRIDQLDLAQR